MFQTNFTVTEKTISEYIERLKNNDKAAATIGKYLRDIRAFANFLQGEEVTQQAAIEWREKLLETHAATSINAAVAAINGFFDYFEIGIKVKPLKIQSQTFLSDDKELTVNEYKRLLMAAQKQGNDRIFHIMQTICSTGIRVSELKFITVKALQAGCTEVRNKGKIRVILTPNDLKKLLFQYAKKHGITSGCVFVTRNGRPIDRSNIWGDMKKLCQAAGVDKTKVFPHSLRRLFARMFYAKNKDIMKLADTLGHSAASTTRLYIMDTGVEHRKIINSLGLVVLPYGT